MRNGSARPIRWIITGSHLLSTHLRICGKADSEYFDTDVNVFLVTSFDSPKLTNDPFLIVSGAGSMSVRTVKVSNVSLGASEQDIKEFFSFSGEIEYVDIKSENERAQIAFVTFKDPQGAETAVLLSGATIVDQPVTIALAPDYTPQPSVTTPSAQQPSATNQQTGGVVESTVQKAEDVVSSMLAKGFILGKDAVNKAKAFDEKLQFTSTAAAKAATIDQKIGLTEKLSIGTTIMNEKVKDLDQKFQVSEKTKTAFATAEQTVSEAGSAIMKNRYVLTGTAWVTGAFNRVTKAAGEVGQKTMEKVAEGEQSGKTESTQQEPPGSAKGANTTTTGSV